MKKILFSACAIGLLALVSCEEKKQVKESINTTLASVKTPEEVKITAEEFTQKAYAGNIAEVKMGELAKKKATNKEVKKFADMMIKDHGKANTDLKKIATEKDIMVPETMPQEMKTKMEDLQGKSGAEFDKAYMDMLVKEHKKDIDLYEKAMKDIMDASYSEYISKTLPVIKTHYEKAKEIQQTLEQTAKK